MKKFYILIFIISCISVNAQITYNGPAEGWVNSGVTLNTNDFSFQQKSYHGFNFVDQSALMDKYRELKFSDSTRSQRSLYFLNTASGNNPDSFFVYRNFSGIAQTNYNPPDDYIAAGPNQLMMVVNNIFRIYDKEGNISKTINAADWYSNLLPDAAPVDPKVLYDQLNNRWIMVWLYIDHVGLKSYYLISTSDDDDPNGIWFNWALPSNMNGNILSNNWADYEGVGFDDKAVYLTSNQFSFDGNYDYVKLRILDKAEIYINSNPGRVTWNDIWNITVPGNSYSASYLRPLRMRSLSDAYYLFYLPNAGGNFCAVYKLVNSITNPVLTADPLPIADFAIAPNAQQLGGNMTIEGGGSALRNEPVYKDGLIYAVHSIKNPNYSSLSCLHFLAVDPANGVVKKDIAAGDAEHFFFYPALSVDNNDNVIISYSQSSANEYAGGYFTIIPNQSGVPQSSTALKRGIAYYYKDNGSGRNRWGDYSGAWIDPVDSSFWICTEYVEALNTWGTWIGNVKYSLPVPVGLLSFTANFENEKVHLLWKVASEINNLGFEIDRKKNSGSYNKLGFFNGRGTTTKEGNYSFTDNRPIEGISHYKLVQVDLNGTRKNLAEISVKVNSIPMEFSLSQNFPNPFNPVTTIKYEIPEKSFVSLIVYDINGREITSLVNEDETAGNYQVKFDGSNFASGVYLYKLQATPIGGQTGNFLQTKKFILMK